MASTVEEMPQPAAQAPPVDADTEMTDLTSPAKHQKLNPESPASHLPPGESLEQSIAYAVTQPLAASASYVTSAIFPPLGRYMHRLIEVRIPSKYLYSKNKEFINRSIWGSNNQYTDDSDVVVCLQHSGKYLLRSQTPDQRNNQDLNSNSGLSVLIRVGPALKGGYPGSESNGVRSRSWKTPYHRYTISVVSVEHTDHVQTPSLHIHKSLIDQVHNQVPHPDPKHRQSTKQEPRILRMVIYDRGLGMYGAGRLVSKQQRRAAPVDVTLRFSQNETVWLVYTLAAILDRGLDETTWTSTRLRYQGLELESVTLKQRIRITLHNKENIHAGIHPVIPSMSAMLFSPPPTNTQTTKYDRYDVQLLEAKNDWQAPQKVTPIAEDIDWDDIQWSSHSVSIKGTVYPIEIYRWAPINYSGYSKDSASFSGSGPSAQ